MGYTRSQISWIGLRLSLGFMFLWAFLDKLIGLGFSTCLDKTTHVTTVLCKSAWLSGGSPATGFLNFGTTGPLKPLYVFLANSMPLVTDVLFMAMLLVIGLTMITGIEMKRGAYIGVLLTLMMWSALLFPANNPIIDDHVVYLFAFLVLASSNADEFFSLKKKAAKGRRR